MKRINSLSNFNLSSKIKLKLGYFDNPKSFSNY